ncbi:MAG: hypothetical protein Q4C95_08270 [Planctomycetia bacterium]|nr:hypothetical protein [Planctomycetia bacterium]
MSLKYRQRVLILFDPQSLWRSAFQRQLFRLSVKQTNLSFSLGENERILSFIVCSSLNDTKEQLRANPNSFLFFSLEDCFDRKKRTLDRPFLNNHLFKDRVKFLQDCYHFYPDLKYSVLCKTFSQITKQEKDELTWFFLEQKAISVIQTEREIPQLIQWTLKDEQQRSTQEINVAELIVQKLPWRSIEKKKTNSNEIVILNFSFIFPSKNAFLS